MINFLFILKSSYSWPILTCILTTCTNFFASASAHLMHQKSHSTHMTCFLCDYAGIGFNIFGCSLMINYICSPIWYYELLRPVYLPLMAALSILCGFLNCLAQTIYKRPYPIDKRILQFSPSIIALLFTNFPVFLHYFSADKDYELNYDIHFLR